MVSPIERTICATSANVCHTDFRVLCAATIADHPEGVAALPGNSKPLPRRFSSALVDSHRQNRCWHRPCIDIPQMQSARRSAPLGYSPMALNLDSALGFHAQSSRTHSKRSQVIANNIANVDTPQYKARDIDFASVLQKPDSKGFPKRHPPRPLWRRPPASPAGSRAPCVPKNREQQHGGCDI